MGSCVSKKAARAGAAREGKVAAPLPPAKEHALSPVVEEEEEVEEVKEVVLSETPAPRQPPEPVKKRRELSSSEEEEACSGSESASVGSVAKEKAMAKAKAGGGGGDEQQEEVVKRAVVEAPERARRTAPAPDQESKPKPKQQGGNGRARSPSPSSAHRRQQQQHLLAPPPPGTRPRREPAVVSAFGCRSGRFSPSAARRAAAESAVRRSHSAREADMSLPAKRCLATAGVNGHGGGNAGGALISRRDPGERSGRRPESPTASKRPSPAPSPVHRQAGGATRRAAARENSLSSTPERSRPRVRDVAPDAGRGGDEQPAALAGGGVPGERKKAEEGALGQNPSVAMECFIFL